MSGVLPPQFPIVEVFGKNAVPGTDITLPIPVPTQVNILVGAASFDDGFPAATRLPPEQGGAYPFGQDVTGILNMLSQYALLTQAGQIAPFNGAAAVVWGGYKIGARVASAATAGLIFTNWLDGNSHDPDADITGWAANYPLAVTVAPAAGTYNDYVLPGYSDYAIDIDSSAGGINFSGFVARRPGQRLILSNTAANLILLLANNVGSAAANRIRAVGDLGIIQGQTLVVTFVAGLNRWLAV